MRQSEWIQIAFASGMVLLSWVRPLDWRRRMRVALLAAVVAGAIFGARLALHGFAGSVVRDWLPVVLLLFPYWQAGQFFSGPDLRIQDWLGRTDEQAFRAFPWLNRDGKKRGWSRYFETAYLMCYPLVPIGLGVLYATHNRSNTDFYWIVVVAASDICFVATIFVPAMPPRLLQQSSAIPVVHENQVRRLNLAVLKKGSIQAITFPSAHVASTMGVALVLMHYLPVTGGVFMLVAISVAIGAFVGRYHYFLDVVLGAIEATVIFLVCLSVFRLG